MVPVGGNERYPTTVSVQNVCEKVTIPQSRASYTWDSATLPLFVLINHAVKALTCKRQSKQTHTHTHSHTRKCTRTNIDNRIRDSDALYRRRTNK